MSSCKFLLLSGLLFLGLITGCSKAEPEPVYPQPASLNEEGNYTITRLENLFRDYNGDTVGIPKSENPYPTHYFSLKGPSYYQEEVYGASFSKITGSYLVNAYTNSLKLTIVQPLVIPAGNYQIDSLTDKRLVMHLITENLTTKVTRTFTVRANRN